MLGHVSTMDEYEVLKRKLMCAREVLRVCDLVCAWQLVVQEGEKEKI